MLSAETLRTIYSDGPNINTYHVSIVDDDVKKLGLSIAGISEKPKDTYYFMGKIISDESETTVYEHKAWLIDNNGDIIESTIKHTVNEAINYLEERAKTIARNIK